MRYYFCGSLFHSLTHTFDLSCCMTYCIENKNTISEVGTEVEDGEKGIGRVGGREMGRGKKVEGGYVVKAERL